MILLGGALAALSFGEALAGPEVTKLSDRLSDLRARVLTVERSLIDGIRTQQHARASVAKIQLLLKLQQQERQLGRQRLVELEKTVEELEKRRETLNRKIVEQQRVLRKFLAAIERAAAEDHGSAGYPLFPRLSEREKLDAPRRKVLANLVDHGLKEIEALHVDLADAETLKARIDEEKEQLVYLFQDLNEQESVLELNRQLQLDLLKKKHHDRVVQLENYRKLKSAEAQVEQMLGEFNARRELERAVETERAASRAMMQGFFAKNKGRLPMPVGEGKVLSAFGRAYDPKSGLYVFKKGIDILAGKAQPVRAVSAGKIAFSGELPDYGRVTILDHGDHFYSLCAHLGDLNRKKGEPVAAGDIIGATDDSGTPVYFEIRARNVAVNPLQWLAN